MPDSNEQHPESHESPVVVAVQMTEIHQQVFSASFRWPLAKSPPIQDSVIQHGQVKNAAGNRFDPNLQVIEVKTLMRPLGTWTSPDIKLVAWHLNWLNLQLFEDLVDPS